MRKSFFYSAAVMALLMMATACERQENKGTETATQSDTVSINMVYADSVDHNHLNCSMTGSLLATDNKQLKRITNEWINERLGGIYTIKDAQNTDSILNFYQKSWADSSIQTIKEFASMGAPIECVWENTFSVLADNGKFVSLSINSYRFEGGAHGSSVISQQTFRKEDGREFGWNNMFSEENKYALRDLLKKGVMQYFEIDREEDLKNFLLNPDDAFLLPLPETPPVMLKDGIRFVYQQYEIAPYASGMPAFTLPYSEVKPLLTTSAKELLDEK